MVATHRLRNGCNAICRKLQRAGNTERGESWSRDSQIHARNWPLGCIFVHALALLWCHTPYVLSCWPTFRNSGFVASSRVKQCLTAWGVERERDREHNFFLNVDLLGPWNGTDMLTRNVGTTVTKFLPTLPNVPAGRGGPDLQRGGSLESRLFL